MRSKLHLTDEELMTKSWIALCLELADFPWYDYKAKEEEEISGEKAVDHLSKYIEK